MPPAANDEPTNSFLYCPLLPHAADVLPAEAAQAWMHAISWFGAACAYVRERTCERGFVAQAYAELLQISCQHDPALVQTFNQSGDASAAQHLTELAVELSGCDVALSVIVPGVIDARGHVPSQLQDLLLQMFGGLQFASDLDSAVTSFRNTGSWEVSLPSLQPESRERCNLQATRDPRPEIGVARAGLCMLTSACNRSSSAPPGRAIVAEGQLNSGSDVPTLRAELHEHACSRNTTSRVGALPRCAVCSERLVRGGGFSPLYSRLSVCSVCGMLRKARP